jgi:hypothetical protein
VFKELFYHNLPLILFFAIIVEEYGLIGGLGVLYFVIVSICNCIAQLIPVWKVVVVGLGFP